MNLVQMLIPTLSIDTLVCIYTEFTSSRVNFLSHSLSLSISPLGVTCFYRVASVLEFDRKILEF